MLSVSPLTCAVIPNGLAFAFANAVGDEPQQICAAAAQTVGNLLGLEFVTSSCDVMSFSLGGCLPKSFLDEERTCGDTTAHPCVCGGATQNSYQHVLATLPEPDGGLAAGAVAVAAVGARAAPALSRALLRRDQPPLAPPRPPRTGRALPRARRRAGGRSRSVARAQARWLACSRSSRRKRCSARSAARRAPAPVAARCARCAAHASSSSATPSPRDATVRTSFRSQRGRRVRAGPLEMEQRVQMALGGVGAGEIRLVQREHVGDLEQARLDRLHLVAEPGHASRRRSCARGRAISSSSWPTPTVSTSTTS